MNFEEKMDRAILTLLHSLTALIIALMMFIFHTMFFGRP